MVTEQTRLERLRKLLLQAPPRAHVRPDWLAWVPKAAGVLSLKWLQAQRAGPRARHGD